MRALAASNSESESKRWYLKSESCFNFSAGGWPELLKIVSIIFVMSAAVTPAGFRESVNTDNCATIRLASVTSLRLIGKVLDQLEETNCIEAVRISCYYLFDLIERSLLHGLRLGLKAPHRKHFVR